MRRGTCIVLITALTIGTLTTGLGVTQSEAVTATAEPSALLPAAIPSQTLITTPMVSGPQCKADSQLVVEGSNACEIVSCGMGIKDTCKITCPADKTPKCSCDCLKTFGPICTEYKANCKCE